MGDRPLSELPNISRPETAGICRIMFFLDDPHQGYVRVRLLQDSDHIGIRPTDFFIEQEQLTRALQDLAEATK